MIEVKINRRASERVAAGHPWIFTSDVTDRAQALAGAAVKVVDPRGRPLGTAHYSSSSQIALRMLTDQVEEIDRDFYLRRLRAAEAHRQTVVRNTDAYRVVHAEADLLPALIVDRYGDYLVMQTLDQGMDAAKQTIASCVEEIFHPRGIVARNDAPVRIKEELPLETTTMSGEVPDSVSLRMNGLALTADLLHGQKTGIFLDQRENYLAAACTRRATLGAVACSIASPLPAASRSISRPSANQSKPSIARPRRSNAPDPLPPRTESPTWSSAKPTSSTCSTPTTAPAASLPW